MPKYIHLHSKRVEEKLDVFVNVDNINWIEKSSRIDNITTIVFGHDNFLFVVEPVDKVYELIENATASKTSYDLK